jgi:serine/threonine-protein kinase ULK/ATG1
LEDFIRMKGCLSEKQAIPLLKDIIDAACLLYDLGITHRDIKTQNILLQNGRAKLADFGFAKELREKDVRETGTGVGTILYMAPQLIF